MQFLNLTNNFI